MGIWACSTSEFQALLHRVPHVFDPGGCGLLNPKSPDSSPPQAQCSDLFCTERSRFHQGAAPDTLEALQMPGSDVVIQIRLTHPHVAHAGVGRGQGAGWAAPRRRQPTSPAGTCGSGYYDCRPRRHLPPAAATLPAPRVGNLSVLMMGKGCKMTGDKPLARSEPPINPVDS